jgi:DNA polymerase-3 subunit beta
MSQEYIVATQGHLMYYNKVKDSMIHEPEYSFLIQEKAISLIKDFDHATIKRNQTNQNILIKQEHRAVLFRRIDEQYLDFMNIIPQHNHISVSVAKKDFLLAMKLGLEAANKTTRQMCMSITNGEEQIKLECEDLDFATEFQRTIPATIEFAPSHDIEYVNTTEKDEVTGELKADRYGNILAVQVDKFIECAPDEKLDIGFNLKFMIDLVHDTDSHIINLKMQAANRAILIGHNMLVMPVMINKYN